MGTLTRKPCKDHGKTKGLHKMGYVSVSVKNTGRVRLHRLVFCQENGVSLSEISGKVVRHTCDNGRCIEPSHLVLGSILDNIQDMDSRGRRVNPKGETHGRSKLCKESVEYIRKHYVPRDKEYSAVALARKFSVSQEAVNKVVSGENWSHLLRPRF